MINILYIPTEEGDSKSKKILLPLPLFHQVGRALKLLLYTRVSPEYKYKLDFFTTLFSSLKG